MQRVSTLLVIGVMAIQALVLVNGCDCACHNERAEWLNNIHAQQKFEPCASCKPELITVGPEGYMVFRVRDPRAHMPMYAYIVVRDSYIVSMYESD